MKIITRTMSIINKKGDRTLGFIEAFVLADTLFLYSLEGKGFLKEMDIPTVESIMQETNTQRIEFVMEPIVFNILKKQISTVRIVRKLKAYGIDLLWLSIN